MRPVSARRVLPSLALGALCLLLWQYSVGWAKVSPNLLVPPSEIWHVVRTPYPLFLRHALPTAVLQVASFAAATILGICLGIAMTASRRLRQAIYPHIVMFQLVPQIAVAPLFIIWLGVGPPSSFAFSVFLAFFPVLVAPLPRPPCSHRATLIPSR